MESGGKEAPETMQLPAITIQESAKEKKNARRMGTREGKRHWRLQCLRYAAVPRGWRSASQPLVHSFDFRARLLVFHGNTA